MDLVVCGAVIKDHNMIKKAIASAPDYPFSKKFILFDGFNKCKLIGDQYNAYKKLISESFPDFKVIEFNENIYFRNMIEKIADISTQERLFIIQDDVISPTMDLKQIESQMNIIKYYVSLINILSLAEQVGLNPLMILTLYHSSKAMDLLNAYLFVID